MCRKEEALMSSQECLKSDHQEGEPKNRQDLYNALQGNRTLTRFPQWDTPRGTHGGLPGLPALPTTGNPTIILAT